MLGMLMISFRGSTSGLGSPRSILNLHYLFSSTLLVRVKSKFLFEFLKRADQVPFDFENHTASKMIPVTFGIEHDCLVCQRHRLLQVAPFELYET